MKGRIPIGTEASPMNFRCPTRCAILQKEDIEIMTETVHSCCQNADLCCNAGNDYRIDSSIPELLVEVGFEKGAKTPLG